MTYWEGAMANGDATRESLRAKPPARFAENFQAPVVLIHGRDDVIIKANQSRRMKDALKKAGKPVELMLMKGGDHSLLTSESRLEALQALDKFVNEHIGPSADQAAP